MRPIFQQCNLLGIEINISEMRCFITLALSAKVNYSHCCYRRRLEVNEPVTRKVYPKLECERVGCVRIPFCACLRYRY